LTVNLIKDYNELKDILNIIPILATEDYLKYKSNNYGWFKSDDFILPFYLTKKFIFKRMFFTTEVIYINSNAGIDEEKKFLKEVVSLSEKMGIDIIDVPPSNAVFNTYPDGSKFIEFGTYVLDLNKSEEELFAGLHQKHRNVVKKAMKDGVIIKQGAVFLGECYKLIKDTYKRQGKGFIDFDEFKSMHDSLGDNVNFYVAVKDDVLQGCAILLWNTNNSSYYLYGGSIGKPYTGAVNYLHWQAILDMKKRGVRYYDFFGARIDPPKDSKYEGIQRFKSRFGGDLKCGYLWKYPVKPFKYYLFRLIFSLYSLTKCSIYKGDIIDNERKRQK